MATLLSHYNYNTFKVAFCTSVLGIILLYGCGKTTSENTDKKKVGTGSIVLVDAFNDTTILDKPAQRVMGLAPGITELLYASLPNDSLICAVTHVCNYPLSAKLKPTISTYPLHFEGILNVKPDLIFSEEGIIHLDDIHKLRLMGFKVFQFRYNNVAAVLDAVRLVGKATGTSNYANHIADSLATETKEISADTTLQKGMRPRVLCITWQDPIYAYGAQTFMSEKLRLAGATNALTQTFAKSYPQLTREYILQLNPDIIFGGKFGALDSTFFTLYPELRAINAYRTKRCYDLDDDLASRISPRYLDAVAEMKGYINAKP